jgi:hypothetical protein
MIDVPLQSMIDEVLPPLSKLSLSAIEGMAIALI